VGSLIFRDKVRKVCAVIYQHLHVRSKLREGLSEVLRTVSQTLNAKLEGCGIKFCAKTYKKPTADLEAKRRAERIKTA
jgi:hypothetical protein